MKVGLMLNGNPWATWGVPIWGGQSMNTAGSQPILTKGFGRRGQVDLIDFQSMPDGDFKFLLNYQDHGIKLYDCRPTKVRWSEPAHLQTCLLAFVSVHRLNRRWQWPAP